MKETIQKSIKIKLPKTCDKEKNIKCCEEERTHYVHRNEDKGYRKFLVRSKTSEKTAEQYL